MDRVAHEHAHLQLSKITSRGGNRALHCPIEKGNHVRSFWGPSFTKMFDNNDTRALQVINVLYQRMSNLFMSVACTRIYNHMPNSRKRVDTNFFRSTIEKPKYEQVRACARKNGCDLASFLLYNLGLDKSDSIMASVFFTGYHVPNSTVAEATYRGQLCVPGRKRLWVDGHDDSVLAHEIGHFLGAAHDRHGFLMRKELISGGPLRFSEHSKGIIQRFVYRDKRAWWMRFHKKDGASIFEDPIIHPQYLRHTVSVVPGGGLFTLVNAEAWTTPIYSYVSLQYWEGFRRTYEIDKNESISTYDDLHMLPIDTGMNSTARISIAFARPRNSEKVLMFALFSRTIQRDAFAFRYHRKRHQLRYRVGFGFNKYSGQAPSTWGPETEIQLPHYQSSKHVYSFAMRSGHIRQPESEDLIVLYEVYDHSNNQHKTTTYYIIGSNISPRGDVRSGWTTPIEIPNLFAFDSEFYNRLEVRVFDLDVSLVDLDRNGRPEVVVYYYIEDIYDMMTFYPFIRVGLNLDSNGHASGGWTDLKPISKFKSVLITQLPGCRDATVAGSFTSGKVGDSQLHIETSPNWITHSLSRNLRSHVPLEDVSQGCRECFTRWSLRKCEEKLKTCASNIDEVHYSSNDRSFSRYSIVSSRLLNATGQLLPEAVLRSSRSSGTQSLFCVGFQYMLRDSTFSCNMVDRERVISKGLEIAFKQELRNCKVKSSSGIEVQTLFANPKGGNGHNLLSIMDQFQLRKKSTALFRAWRYAFNRIRRRTEFSATGTDHFRMKYFKEGEMYIARIYFSDRHFKEGTDY